MAEQPTSHGYGTQDPNTTLSEGHTTAQSSVQNTEGLPPELVARQKKYYGLLPLNRGHENGFAGEMSDAGLHAFFSYFCFRHVLPPLEFEPVLVRKQSITAKALRGGKPLLPAHSQPIAPAVKTTAPFIRGAYWGTGFLALYASLSTLGIDYRGWTDIVVEGEPNPELEKVVTRATTAGALVGAALGIPIVNYRTRITSDLKGITPGLLPIKRLPLSLGVSTYFAFSFNIIAQTFAEKHGEGASVAD